MNIEHYSLLSHGRLPALIQDYLTASPKVQPFYAGFPSEEEILRLASGRLFAAEDRACLVDTLMAQHPEPSPSLRANIQRLGEPNVYTITTGHQLCMAGGPLFFIYKIASAIALARKHNASQESLHFIPVFWMASEDHDFEEIRTVEIFGHSVQWNTDQHGPVGRFGMSGADVFWEELRGILGDRHAFAHAFERVRKCYEKGTLAEATRSLAYELFGEKELVVIDADHAQLKRRFAPVIEKEITERFSQTLVQATNGKLEALGYKTQVHPREINLFFLGNGDRERIRFEGQYFIGGQPVSETFLREQVHQHPEHFSPNVIMRPLYQETILPNAAYIGGPGELSYWLQIRDVFTHHGVSFPVLVLRDSALIISPSVKKKMEKLELGSKDIFRPPQEIIQEWIHTSGVQDLTEEKRELEQIFRRIAAKLKKTDPTLESSAMAEWKKAESSADHLEKKMIRHLKQKEEVRIQQLEKLLADLYPSGVPQERVTNWMQFADLFAEDFPEFLIRAFDPLKSELKVIYGEKTEG